MIIHIYSCDSLQSERTKTGRRNKRIYDLYSFYDTQLRLLLFFLFSSVKSSHLLHVA